jgi:hypothetical protein
MTTLLLPAKQAVFKALFNALIDKLSRPAAISPPVDNSDWRDDWSIAIYSGKSPFHIAPDRDVNNPVLTWRYVSDIPAAFVADPFMIRVNRAWHMFFEVMNRESRKGEIGLATSGNGLEWRYQQIVLAEPYHLSYPYVFEWMNDYYMIPESYMAGAVRLYKAIAFPTRWAFAGTLVAGPYYADPSILRYDDKWWLFVDASPDMQHNTLRLFWSDDLLGIWKEHPLSPIVNKNPHIARPAGRMLVLGNRPIRFAQDCYPTYGIQVQAFEITALTTTDYQERAVGPVIKAGETGWNASGMHQIDAHRLEDGRWFACVDGFYWKDVAQSENERDPTA